LQRSSPALLLFFYFIIFISRFRLARFSFFIIFFSVNIMSAAVFAISIRFITDQITIGNNKVSPFSFRGRKFSLNNYRINKTAPRLRRD
jgi:flagellar biosynthesis protein FlhB